MKLSRNVYVYNLHDVSRKRAQLDSSAPLTEARDAPANNAERDREKRKLNGKTSHKKLPTMNFLGSPDEIHSA
jgi:hypothetical protein